MAASVPTRSLTLPVLQRLPVEPQRSRQPFHVLAKPTGAICNIDCEYCFYLEKENLYPHGEDFMMKESVMEDHVRQYIEGQPLGTEEINFAWQGGEPTLRGLDFFRKVVELEEKYKRPGMTVTNAFQTNGILVNGEWARFFKEHNFLIGISIDGPEHLHDRYRKDKGGHGTFKRVMRGLEQLKEHGCEFNTLTVVQRSNSDHPAEVYEFLKSIGSTFLQFIPIVEVEGSEKVSGRSVLPEKWGTFMSGIFDEWVKRKDIGKIFVQHFDMMLGLAMGYQSSLCVHSETCGRAVAIEHNGDLFSCDHFVNWEDHIGNVTQISEGEMMDSEQQHTFGQNKHDKLPTMCKECDYLNYCWGGCPAHRNTRTPTGEAGLNYLCSGYLSFYKHTVPYFKAMGEALRHRLPASEFRRFMEGGEFNRPQPQPRLQNAGPAKREIASHGITRKVNRNSQCPCGSGKKYKKCCGQ